MRAGLLSAAEEIELATRIECGDLKAKNQLIERNLGLVHAVARTYRTASVPFADLVQEGTVGLARAAERFDHRRGLKFSTYAVWWIRRSMLDAIASSNVIRIPAKANQRLAAVRRAEAELQRLGPGHTSDAAIAEHTQLSETTVRSL
jgi:RNA polymerase primary sigma factor